MIFPENDFPDNLSYFVLKYSFRKSNWYSITPYQARVWEVNDNDCYDGDDDDDDDDDNDWESGGHPWR